MFPVRRTGLQLVINIYDLTCYSPPLQKSLPTTGERASKSSCEATRKGTRRGAGETQETGTANVYQINRLDEYLIELFLEFVSIDWVSLHLLS